MNRRNFIKSSAALFCAPAIVRADSIMKIWVPPQSIVFCRDASYSNIVNLELPEMAGKSDYILSGGEFYTLEVVRNGTRYKWVPLRGFGK